MIGDPQQPLERPLEMRPRFTATVRLERPVVREQSLTSVQLIQVVSFEQGHDLSGALECLTKLPECQVMLARAGQGVGR